MSAIKWARCLTAHFRPTPLVRFFYSILCTTYSVVYFVYPMYTAELRYAELGYYQPYALFVHHEPAEGLTALGKRLQYVHTVSTSTS